MRSIRAIPEDLSPDAVAEVDGMLDEIVRTHGVHIPLAIESGSRAWGFPSPDSDYDGRFIYVRPASQSLSIWPRRDVIETPIIGDMDVNGWDLSKALRLLLKGNAVVVEWLRSPIVYRGEGWFREEVSAFAAEWMDRGRAASHYLHLSRRQRAVYLDRDAPVALKKVFYALRPAAALRWMRLHPDQMLAPMHFPTLMAECDPPADVTAVTDDLIALKATTREMGQGMMPPVLLDFIDAELEQGEAEEVAPRPASADAMSAADALFVRVTHRLDREAAGG